MNARASQWGVGLAALLVAAGGVAHAIAYRPFQPDDAFIFLVYARNLVAGHGLTFNGEVVEGFSSLLWTLLVSGLGATGMDLLAAAKLLGNALYLLLPVLLVAIAIRLQDTQGERRRHAVPAIGLAAILLALPPLAIWADGALETLLHATLVTLACWWYFLGSELEPQPRTAALAGLAFGLIAWTRPEGFAFIAAVPVFEASRWIARRKPCGASIGVCLLVAAGMLCALLAWRLATYGHWLPSTVSAKTGDLAAQWRSGLPYLLDFLGTYPAFVAAYAIATVALLVRRGHQGWFAWLALIFVTGQLAFCALSGGDWMPGHRFIVPVLPLACLVIALALWEHARLFGAVVAVLVALGVYASVPLHQLAMLQTQSASGDIMMGRYIASLRLAPDTRIAVVDAGAIPYFSELPTVDMVGLNNAHIAALPGGFMAKWDNDYVLAQRPGLIQVHTYLHEGAAYPLDDFQGALRLWFSDEFQRWYEWDPQSPIANLYRRRDRPLAGSFMQGFSRGELSGRYDAGSQRVSVQVRKTGPGTWPAAREARMQGATVYLRARWLADDGTALADFHQPIPRFMKEGDTAQVEWAVPAQPGKRLEVCLTLMSIGDFPSCVMLRAE